MKIISFLLGLTWGKGCGMDRLKGYAMEYRDIKDLVPLLDNPRFIRDKRFKNLCQSIKDNPKFFEARPVILSDRTGHLVIIAGNQRYEAAKKNKMKQVPTYLIQGLTEEQEKEITIRDNAHQGEWDMDLLSTWADFPIVEWGVDLPEDWAAIPNENKSIDEESMADTKNECPKCGFKW